MPSILIALGAELAKLLANSGVANLTCLPTTGFVLSIRACSYGRISKIVTCYCHHHTVWDVVALQQLNQFHPGRGVTKKRKPIAYSWYSGICNIVRLAVDDIERQSGPDGHPLGKGNPPR